MLLRTNSVNDWSPLVLPPALSSSVSRNSLLSRLDSCPTYAFLMARTYKHRPSYTCVYTRMHSYTQPHTRATDGCNFISSTLDCPCCSSLCCRVGCTSASRRENKSIHWIFFILYAGYSTWLVTREWQSKIHRPGRGGNNKSYEFRPSSSFVARFRAFESSHFVLFLNLLQIFH